MSSSILYLVLTFCIIGNVSGLTISTSSSTTRTSSPLVKSPLFTTRKQRHGNIAFSSNKHHSVRYLSSPPSSDNNETPKDAEIIGKTVENNTSSEPSASLFKLILSKFDTFGMQLKPKAVDARNKATSFTASGERGKHALYTSKACLYFFLFIMYRSYRGFFVVLPAVFREVYKKMERAVDTPFDEDDDVAIDDDINPKTGKVRFRTRFTVSILSGFLTFTYVLNGAFNVLMKFLRTMTQDSVEPAFEAAADEMELNEGKILKLAKNHPENIVNGED